jgi:FtsH-binding integral membrane protein
MGLLGLFVALIIGLFVGGIFQALIGFAGALIFSGLLIVDVQRAKSAQDTMGNAVVITLGIYLDIVNLFLYILRILSYFQGGSRR